MSGIVVTFALTLYMQVERYSQRISELEKTIDRLTLDINSAEAKCRSAENRLMAEESVWKTERTALEEKMKKVSSCFLFCTQLFY